MFTNFTAHGNASQTVAGIFAIEMDHCIGESYGSGNDPQGNTPVGAVTGNYAAVGKFKPKNEANVGIFDANTTQLFVNPTQGDFTINPAAGMPVGTGVDPAILTELTARAASFGISVAWDGWITDNLRLSQTILDNIPGVNDGLVGNEIVLTDFGVMNSAHTEIDFVVFDGAWRAARMPNADNANQQVQKFHLNDLYHEWYDDIATNHLNAGGTEYARIRYGDSEIKQDQVFVGDWLTVSNISAERTTLINGYDNDFTLDGDLLVVFDGVTPQVGDTYDLITAGTITAAENMRQLSGTTLFDRVLFDGFTPDDYTLEVVAEGGQEVARLTILAALPVALTSFTGDVLDKQNHELQWETSYEEDNDFFEVQRSVEGSAWTVLGNLAAVADGTNGGNYTFNDRAPLSGLNLYRLRQVNNDGTSAYSGILRLKGLETEEMKVFPNPTRNQFTVITTAARKGLRLINSLGQDVTSQIGISGLVDGYRINVSKLSTGVYLLEAGGQVNKVDIRR
jgi:hypothetical protein